MFKITKTASSKLGTPRSATAARSRWAALGAAVAVSIGVGGVGLVEATVSEGERPVLVQISPCRLLDTRADQTVGPRDTPIGTGETYTVSAHGMQGNCDIPADAVGLSMNVTGLRSTVRTNIRIFPADAALPLTSNLNPAPGLAPAPNSATTGLDDMGQFSIFNEFGEVDVFVDVNGYYEDHDHDDRYVQQTDLLWAVVDADGELERNSPGVVSAERLDGVLPTGDYAVVFDRDISQCAYQATVGRPGVSAGPPIGFAMVANWGDDPSSGVIVYVKDQDGLGADRGFHLTVFCGAEFDPPVSGG